VGFRALEKMICQFADGEEAQRWLVERTNKSMHNVGYAENRAISLTHLRN
jgi:hypothetical protein